MQINISDHDVKWHASVLRRLLLFLLVLMVGTVAALNRSGAFSHVAPPEIAKSSLEAPAGTDSLVRSDSIVNSDSQLVVESALPPESPNRVDVASVDSKHRSANDSEAIKHVGPPTNLTLPLVEVPSPENEVFSTDETNSVSNQIDLKPVFPKPESESQIGAVDYNSRKTRIAIFDAVSDQAQSTIRDYAGIQFQFRQRTSQRIARVAKRIASFGADGYQLDSAVLDSETLTLETSQSDDLISDTPNDDSNAAAEPTDAIIIRNAKINRGSVAFLVDRDVKQLKPGEILTLSSERPAIVRFHRGGEFGKATLTLTKGAYEFQATARGWYLEVSDGE